MNIIRLNTLNDDQVIIKKQGENANESDHLNKDMLYLDLSKLTIDEKIEFNTGIPAFAKYVDYNGEVKFVAPLLYTSDDPDKWLNINYCAIPGFLLIPGLDGDMTIKQAVDTIFSHIPYITQEEFYYIPKDEVWSLYTQEDYKVAWDKLYPLVERYGVDYLNENGLLLTHWYKSLTFESDSGIGNPSKITDYFNGDIDGVNEENIIFDTCTLAKRYENESIVYYLYAD